MNAKKSTCASPFHHPDICVASYTCSVENGNCERCTYYVRNVLLLPSFWWKCRNGDSAYSRLSIMPPKVTKNSGKIQTRRIATRDISQKENATCRLMPLPKIGTSAPVIESCIQEKSMTFGEGGWCGSVLNESQVLYRYFLFDNQLHKATFCVLNLSESGNALSPSFFAD